ncbi:3-dehydroquinate synthase [Candidatus Puniceispirillum marinum]|uniref:3-dehydroquinate synthase n=1 Tax=Puniceispirillum marinum (strain IMCC1322) TaxID=488538 RepID=D5BMW2_PUNMI|nr:3-dehydroquinate synthase [Candidatus Puniceispirillum marinum]ADE40155.1 3-dehydroquinate synthase [Candidatus Puniceispirillum marinum IMCC1322]
MQNLSQLTVGLGDRAYNIVIGPGLLAQAGDILGPIAADRHIVIISDEQVAALHLASLQTSLTKTARKIDALTVPAGETSKSMSVLARLLDDILALGVDRSVLLIAFGGGVIGDLAGFAAASLLRGVDFVQIPTSLLAQVDSSVGGKTGVNAAKGKNLIGAFYQPKAVLADTALLASLPPRELCAGFAEVIKYGLLGDRDFFEWLEANGQNVLALDDAAIAHAVYTSCAAKARIVEADEREAGQRALLNLGHTFAHAFEAEAKYDGRLLHGEAVAAGMGLAFDLSVALNICNGQDAGRCKALLEASGLPSGLSNLPAGRASADTLLGHMKHDKKVKDGTMHFVLVRSIGDAFVSGDVPPETVLALLE